SASLLRPPGESRLDWLTQLLYYVVYEIDVSMSSPLSRHPAHAVSQGAGARQAPKGAAQARSRAGQTHAKRGRPLHAAKHERIIAAATEAFLDFGFNAANMDLVAQRANVSKMTVYTHFKSKEALFGAIIDGLAGGLVAHINRFAVGDMEPEPALRQFGRM